MCSDQRGVLYPFNPFYKLNPGETKMVGKDELREMSRELGNKEARLGLQDGVDAVLLQDILSSVSSHSVVIKMDIEGYECKVLLCDATIFFRIFCSGSANIDSFWRKWKVYSCYLLGVEPSY